MNNRISSKRVGSDVKPILAFENVSKDYGKLRALDSVSLTVNRVADGPAGCEIAINLIPHTVQNTSLRNLVVGRRVNLEIDLIARYVERMLGAPRTAA